MRAIKRILATLALVTLSLSISAKDRVVFTPQWTPQAQFAGYYAAKELGFYDEVGLDVLIKHPTNSTYALKMLERGESDIITAMLVDAMSGYNDGVDLVNIMQLTPHSTMVIISHSPLNGDKMALNGKRIATWKAGFSTIFIAMLNELNIDIEWITLYSGVNAFLSKSVDATTAMSYNEIQTIKETGFEVKEESVLKLSEIGITIPEDGLYASREIVTRNPDAVKKFREASIKGWQWVAQNRERAIEIVLKVAEENELPTNEYHQSKMLNDLLSNIYREGDSYNLDRDDYKEVCELMLDAKIVTKTPSFDSFIIEAK